jgi:ABC-type transporter Mla maintaining outer membrane lipid asymmetry permease subunit MlaE
MMELSRPCVYRRGFSLGASWTKAAFDWRLFWLTMQECSAPALPIVGMISFLTGLIFALWALFNFASLGPASTSPI